MRERESRLSDPAGRQLVACSVVQRDLAELGEIEHRILQNAILLPGLEVGVFEVAGDRLENVDVGLHVQGNLFRHAACHVLVAGDDRLAGCVAQRIDRHRAVQEQRQNTGSGQQKREAGCDPPQLVILLDVF